MKTPSVVALTILLTLAGASVATAQGSTTPKPGPEHARLGYFVGKWKQDGEIKPSPMGPAGKLTSTESCEWFEGQFSVVCRSEGTGPWGPSKAMAILGFDAETKTYTFYEVNNSPMAMASVSKGTVQGKTWSWTHESMMGGKKIKTRATMTEVSPSQYTFIGEMLGADGKWTPMAELTATKTP